MALDKPEELISYLRHQRHIDEAETPAVRELSGGISNRTWLVQRGNGVTWVIKQALPKLQVPSEWLSSPLRIHSEAAALRLVPALLQKGALPDFVFEDRENHVVGMAAVPQPHENWKTLLLRGHIEDEHIRQFAGMLGQLHQQSAERKSELLPVFADRSFFESLRLEPYYRYTAAQVPAAAAFFEGVIADTLRRQDCLVHGDYSPKNILIFDGRMVLLDYEVIHFGEPAFDLGFSLTHLLSKAHFLKSHRLAFLRAAHAYWRTYLQSAGKVSRADDFELRAANHTLACLLARVGGRSVLEYFSAAHRRVQQEVVLGLMAKPPRSVSNLIDAFAAQLPE